MAVQWQSYGGVVFLFCFVVVAVVVVCDDIDESVGGNAHAAVMYATPLDISLMSNWSSSS